MCEKGTSQGTRFLFLFIEWKRKRKKSTRRKAAEFAEDVCTQ